MINAKIIKTNKQIKSIEKKENVLIKKLQSVCTERVSLEKKITSLNNNITRITSEVELMNNITRITSEVELMNNKETLDKKVKL